MLYDLKVNTASNESLISCIEKQIKNKLCFRSHQINDSFVCRSTSASKSTWPLSFQTDGIQIWIKFAAVTPEWMQLEFRIYLWKQITHQSLMSSTTSCVLNLILSFKNLLSISTVLALKLHKTRSSIVFKLVSARQQHLISIRCIILLGWTVSSWYYMKFF